MRLRFGDCVLDTDRRALVRAGQVVHLTPKAFQLLTVLTDARPRAISKDDLQETLWPDTFVSEANLAGLINEVRTAIGDSARSARYIKTLHGFGDSFGGALQEKSGWLVNLATEPRLDPLRDEPRFTALLTAVNLAALAVVSQDVVRRVCGRMVSCGMPNSRQTARNGFDRKARAFQSARFFGLRL